MGYTPSQTITLLFSHQERPAEQVGPWRAAWKQLTFFGFPDRPTEISAKLAREAEDSFNLQNKMN